MAGASIQFETSATDLVDGSVAVSCNPASGSTFPLGTTTITCTAEDKATPTPNKATGSFTVTLSLPPWHIVYNPIDSNGQSQFQAGSTVPVKFAFDRGTVTDAVATLQYRYGGGTLGTDQEAPSTVPPSTGNTFRYDSGTNQYIYNWGTTKNAGGSYILTISVDGAGSQQLAPLSLKSGAKVR
jgi:hypothetical protein